MLELFADPQGDENLFEVEFLPQEGAEHKGLSDAPAIKTQRGRLNRILVGVPQLVNIFSSWPKNESLAEEIKALQDKWEFYHVRLACSFIPDRGCRFVWGRMQVELLNANSQADAEVVAFDLFPRQVGQTQVFRRHFKVTPTLEYVFGKVSAEAGSEHETIRYEPNIIADGLLTSSPLWTLSFKQGLIGSRELFLLLKKPKTATVQARFTLGAEVHSVLGPLPLRAYRNDELVDQPYTLIP